MTFQQRIIGKVNRRRVMPCLSLIGFLASSFFIHAAPPSGYYQVWGDEFQGNSLNTKNWEYARNGWRNSAYNTSAAVSVTNDCLVITTYTAGGTNFTGFIDSQNLFNGGYGYYEASIQYSNAPGQWSAFWLQTPYMMNAQPDGTLGNTNNSPTNGVEIDVFEHRCVDGNNSSWINGGDNALHWNGYGPQEQSAVWSSQSLGVGTGFHTYGLLWTTNKYSFYLDGNVTWSTSQYLVSSAEQFIRLTSEIQSNSWAGTVPPGGYPSLATSQVKMFVDYVRYYVPTNVIFWSGASSAYWTNSANWVSNMLPAATSDLTFSYFSTKNRTMTPGQDYSVDGLVFLGAGGGFTVNAGNTVTLGAGGIDMIAANYNVTLNAAVDLAQNQMWTVGPNMIVNGNLSGAGTLTKASFGTLVLNGTNSFSGTLNVDRGGTNNDGLVLLANPAAAANVSSVWIRNTNLGVSSLQLSNNVIIPSAVTLAGRNNRVVPLEAVWGTSNVIAAGLTLTGGGSNYWLQADTSTLYLGGFISAGGTATGPRMLTLLGAGNFSISASIQNGSASALSLVRTNSGTLTLSGASTFTGGTTNWRGTLFINGSLAGPLAVNGGILSGTGSVAGNTMLQSGCELSPGTAIASSIGTISFGSNLTLSSGSTTYLEINATTQTNDMVIVTGTLNCGGTLNVGNLGGTLALGQSFHLFNAGSYAGNFSSMTLPPLNAGLTWDTSQLTNNGTLTVAALPELLGVTSLNNGQRQLNWNYGTLQTSTNAAGPYSDVTGAASPYMISTTNAQQFYRVNEN
jgi:autotransporter-associated beta strand protein